MIDEKEAWTYPRATICPTTERGGRVTRMSTTAVIHDKNLSVAGDVVTHNGGTETTSIHGAGFGAIWTDKPVAEVGSRPGNGDRITTAAQHEFGVTVCDDKPIPGLLDPARAPSCNPAHRGGERV
ncbi:MAG TPA: hypothetical protein VL689_01295 [Paraburkholderia sp.]|jgi:hypothetical protein|nr:hypothetical protein [Paraburkholderia sp.]